ncbi:hypothetical protein A5677_00500 [Mycobacterium malmoense]|uniref:Uncharacterized protein n=1 Tax=Mycobacterium malmoense TaxID=1780 RepID=A0A1B9CI57_MYCMA|nr:hypothetical protein [Mycobacterium malmoense]OCB41886.1 hypothetical protein A5677_00500 [Mycobacterium malmoense]
MATDAKGAWIGFGVGDTDPVNAKRTDPNWEAVTLLTTKLHDKFSTVRNLGLTPRDTYDILTSQAVAMIAKNYGMTVPVDEQGYAVANLAFRTKLGSYPPPPPPTHAMFTVRGTGGIIGLDYTSQIAQALPGLYHEHPIDYAASMGGIPVGAANDPNAPSGDECAEQARQMLTDAVLGSTVTFAIAGYSLGTKGVILFLNDLFDPNHPLYEHRDRLVCVVLVADPWRPFGKSFYLGPVQAGQGIGAPSFTMSKAAQDALGWRCCWLVNPADLYTNAPLGGTGQVLDDVQEFILGTAVSDPLGTMAKFVQMLLQLVVKDGGLLKGGQTVNQPGGTQAGGGGLLGGVLGGGGLLGGLLGGGSPASLITGIAGGSIGLTAGLVPLILPLLLGSFEGLIDGISGNGTNLPTGPAADVQAAILALKFFGSGTAPHLSYHDTAWGPGPQTFLQLGIQHAADYGSRVPVAV